MGSDLFGIHSKCWLRLKLVLNCRVAAPSISCPLQTAIRPQTISPLLLLQSVDDAFFDHRLSGMMVPGHLFKRNFRIVGEGIKLLLQDSLVFSFRFNV